MNPQKLRARTIDKLCRLFYRNEQGCWIWLGFINKQGYGWTSYRHKNTGAHRLSYTVFVGPIPPGLTLDHLCRNKVCINPKHLEPVTTRENTLRGIGPAAKNAVKTECLRGHPLVPENVHVNHGHRICRACRRIFNQDIYARLYSKKANGGLCRVTLKRRGLV